MLVLEREQGLTAELLRRRCRHTRPATASRARARASLDTDGGEPRSRRHDGTGVAPRHLAGPRPVQGPVIAATGALRLSPTIGTSIVVVSEVGPSVAVPFDAT